MNIFLRICLVMVIVGVVCLLLPKLFPPTEKDYQDAQAEAERRLRRLENAARDREEAAARREAKKGKKA